MFDIGFSELLLCFIVALVVLGPERLPKVARTVGRFTGQARAYMRNLSSELERETQASDLKKQLDEANRMARSELSALEHNTRATVESLKPTLPSSDADKP